MQRIGKHLADAWNLSEQDLKDLMQAASAFADEHASLHQHLDVINAQLSPEQKTKLLRGLWEVACADGEIHHYEEHLIRRLADLMYVPHKDFIRSKHQALEDR